MEVLLKIGVTIAIVIFVYFQIVFLATFWKSHIDPKESFARFLTKMSQQSDLIATRDPNSIYQDGKVVGNVTGKVTIGDDSVVFEAVTDTSELDLEAPFEYRREKLKIISFGTFTAEVINMPESGVGVEIQHAVLENIVCARATP